MFSTMDLINSTDQWFEKNGHKLPNSEELEMIAIEVGIEKADYAEFNSELIEEIKAKCRGRAKLWIRPLKISRPVDTEYLVKQAKGFFSLLYKQTAEVYCGEYPGTPTGTTIEVGSFSKQTEQPTERPASGDGRYTSSQKLDYDRFMQREEDMERWEREKAWYYAEARQRIRDKNGGREPDGGYYDIPRYHGRYCHCCQAP